MRQTLGVLEADLVSHARLLGVTWTELAEDLRLTRQGARQRHLENDPLPRRQRHLSGFDAFMKQLRASRETMRE